MINFNFDKSLQIPIYEQLYNYIKKQILEGNFPYNMKLPSKRVLSNQLQCSQNTIQNAYDQLIAEGYIMSKPRSGFYVCKVDGIINIEENNLLHIPKISTENSYKFSFSHHGVDTDNFPFATWNKIIRNVILENKSDLLKIGNPKGDYNLRSSIASYLKSSRGVKCYPEQIVISSGTEFLIQLLIQLFEHDYIYGLENPGYEKLSLIFKSNLSKYTPISVDKYGLSPSKLYNSEANVICITPSHQFPTGNIMPINRRIELLNWAYKGKNRYIIEDDYDSEFKYSGKPIQSLQSLDSNGKVIYIGSFSKSLTPAIRISYMVLPKHLVDVYNKKLSFYICPVPVLEQKALFQFIHLGHFERHLNRMRNIYKKKREFLVSTINTLLPKAKILGANTGLHLILDVNNSMSEKQLIKCAQNVGVHINGISQYYIKKPSNNKALLLLGFATLTDNEIYKAVNLLKEAWY